MFAQESVMDIQKEKIAHEKHLFSQGVDFKYLPNIQYSELENVYELIEWDEEYSEALNEINSSWCTWQAANAVAVPEWISTSDRMPKEGEEVLVHSLGQVRQVTRDSKWAGGFKERNCYGWQAAYGQSHWMPKSIELPEQYHFYYENDAKQKAMIEAQEQSHE